MPRNKKCERQIETEKLNTFLVLPLMNDYKLERKFAQMLGGGFVVKSGAGFSIIQNFFCVL